MLCIVKVPHPLKFTATRAQFNVEKYHPFLVGYMPRINPTSFPADFAGDAHLPSSKCATSRRNDINGPELVRFPPIYQRYTPPHITGALHQPIPKMTPPSFVHYNSSNLKLHLPVQSLWMRGYIKQFRRPRRNGTC